MCNSKTVLILQIILTTLVVRYKTHAPTQQFYKHVSLLHEDQCPKSTGILYWCITSKIHRCPVKFNGNYSTSLYRIALLIIAGIETNPGPRPPKYSAVLVQRHVNGEKRHWPVMNATHGIMHHVQGSTHKNTQDLQAHLFPGIA